MKSIFPLLSLLLLTSQLYGLKLNFRTRELINSTRWKIKTETKDIDPQRTAVIICDLWNSHWCKDSAERIYALAQSVNTMLNIIRPLGIKIIHAPSGSMAHYNEYDQREQFLATIRQDGSSNEHRPIMSPSACYCGVCFPGKTTWCAIHSPACCVDPGKNSNPCSMDPEQSWYSGENKHIEIKDGDFISDDGTEIYNFIKKRNIEYVFIVGVHLNLCVWGRSFGIQPMVKRGVKMVLIRDLTTVFPHPDLLEYLSHKKQDAAFISWLEKYWCPTIQSHDLIQAAS